MKLSSLRILYYVLFFVSYTTCFIIADGTQTSVDYGSAPDVVGLDGDQFLVAYTNGGTRIARYDRYTNIITFQMSLYGSSGFPDIERLNSTHFVGVWFGNGGVSGRICHIDGCTTTDEFRADSGSVNTEAGPKVAKLGNVTAVTNRFLVAWREDNPTGPDSVIIRTYDLNGNPLTSPVTAVLNNLYVQFDLTTVLSGSEWVWVLAYDNAGTLTPNFRFVYANTTWSNDVACNMGGSFVSAANAISHPNNLWAVAYTAGGHVKVQIFYPNGATYSDPGIINTGTGYNQNPSRIAGISGGKFAVVWTSYDQDGDGSGIFGNIVYPNGTNFYTEDVTIPDSTTGWQYWAAVAGFTSGSGANQFVPVWFDSATNMDNFKIVNIPSPSPTPSPSRTPSVTPSQTPSNTPSPTPSGTPSVTPSPSRTPSVTPSVSPSSSPSVTPTPSITPYASTSPTPSQSPSSTPSATPSETPTSSPSSSGTPSPSQTPSITPSTTTTPSVTPSFEPIVGSSQKKSNSAVVAGVAGGVGGGGALMLICAGGFIFIRRKKQQNSSKEEPELELKPPSASATPLTLASLDADKGWKINISDIDMKEELGRGAFGVVYKCIWRNTDCVIKLLNISQTNEAAINAFIREAHNVKSLRNHPNVCAILGVCPDPVGIIMEFVPGGSLLHCIANKQIVMTPKKVLAFAKDIASGMSHLHAENIIHLDLACRNLLVTFGANDEQHLKITDFGLSRIMEAETYTASSDATFPLRWTAPETLSMRMVSRASDVWSFAVTIWEMIERKIPYMETPSAQVLDYVTSGKRLSRPTKVDIPDSLWELMIQCWTEAPVDRPTFEQICTQLRKIEEQFKEAELKKSAETPKGHNGAFFTGSDALMNEDEKPKQGGQQPNPQPAEISVESTYGNATTSGNTSVDSSLAPYTRAQQQQGERSAETESFYGNVSANNSAMENNSAPYKPFPTEPEQSVAATQKPYGNRDLPN